MRSYVQACLQLILTSGRMLFLALGWSAAGTIRRACRGTWAHPASH